MSEEIQDVVQIVRVTYEGIEIAMKVGSGGLDLMKSGLSVIASIIKSEKSLGKTSMRKLLLKGGDLQVFQFNIKDMKKVKKLAKKYGVLYSILPDINKKDNMCEIIFHTEATPRVNMMLNKIKGSKISTFDEYLKEGDEKELGKLIEHLQKEQASGVKDFFHEKVGVEDKKRVETIMEGLIEKVGLYAMEKKSINTKSVEENFKIDGNAAEDVIKKLEDIGVLERVDGNGEHKVIMNKETFKERIKKYQELANRMKIISRSKDLNLVDVTISKTLIVAEDKDKIKTRVPGSWGEGVKYIWLDRDDLMDIHNGKTLLTFIDKEKDYKLYDDKNNIITTLKGADLYNKHYDKVEAKVREKYEKSKVKVDLPKIKKDIIKR